MTRSEPKKDDDFNFEKLAREIVMSRLSSVEKASATAADVAHKIMVTAVKSTGERQHPMVTIIKICRGTMSGILIIEKNLVETAAQLLQKAVPVATEVDLDPESVFTWFLEGIAEVTPMMNQQARWDIQATVDREYLEMGRTYRQLVEAAAKRPSSFS